MMKKKKKKDLKIVYEEEDEDDTFIFIDVITGKRTKMLNKIKLTRHEMDSLFNCEEMNVNDI